jgi:hypothetical protein
MACTIFSAFAERHVDSYILFALVAEIFVAKIGHSSFVVYSRVLSVGALRDVGL